MVELTLSLKGSELGREQSSRARAPPVQAEAVFVHTHDQSMNVARMGVKLLIPNCYIYPFPCSFSSPLKS